MFPYPPIESFYRSRVDGLWLDDEYPAVASLCEEWLLSLAAEITKEIQVGDLKPAGKAMEIMKRQKSDYSNVDRLDFAIAMALSIPSESTGKLFEAYRDTIEQRSYEIGDHVLNINAQAHLKIDVYKAFSHLPGREFVAMARHAYMTELEHVRLQAVARDDVRVFKLTLPDDPEKAPVVAYIALMMFPIDPESAIYKTIVTDEVAGKILFKRQVSQLRYIASAMSDIGTLSRSNEVYGFLRPAIDEIPVLEPFQENKFPEANAGSFTFIHRDPDFARKLTKNAYQATSSFFDLIGNNQRGHCGAQFVQEVTEAFMEAGLSASYLMSTGVCGELDSERPISLKHALRRLADMGHNNWKFYSFLYQEFLKPYPIEQIIADAEGNGEVIQALHLITGDRAYLEAASEATVARILESDLGL
jgi:hypothetical protein